MKIIKLFLLFSLIVWAEFKLDVPQNIDVIKLECIVKNGWNEDNKTLNDLIVSNAERVMPEILEKIKKPVLRGIVTEDDPFPISRIPLNRDDYLWILAYVKYLEANYKIDLAINLYIESLKGLNNIEDKTMLSAIFHLIMEKMIVDSLNNNLQVISNLKYEEIEKILILNTDILMDALKEDQRQMMEILTLKAKLSKKILALIRQYNEGYTEAYMNIKNKKELIKNKKIFDKDKKKIVKIYTDWVDRNIIPKDISRDKLVASYIFLISLPRFKLIEEVWANIDRNKKFLDSL